MSLEKTNTSTAGMTGQRRVPMEVLVLGLPRTGTFSMRAALKELGYDDVYHMASCMMEYPAHQEKWLKALQAKYEGKGKPFTKEQWDDLLGSYMAVSDMPCVDFWQELLEMYPDAKVVLTTRSVESWHASITNTIWKFAEKICAPTTNPARQVARSLLPSSTLLCMLTILLEHAFGMDFPENGRRKFLDHNEAVRNAVPRERLLEFQVKDGWDPLCKFLGKPVPNMPFPKVNDTASWNKLFGTDLLMMDVVSGVKLAAIVGVVSGVAYTIHSYWPVGVAA